MIDDPVRTARVPLDAVVPADLLPGAFEASSLIQCTEVSRVPGRRRPEWRAVVPAAPMALPALAEFDHQEAAVRLATLLDDLGFTATHEVTIGGGRRRYEVHSVVVPHAQREDALRLLAGAWRQGRRALLGTDPIGSSSPRNAQRGVLARAAWRAALLAGGRRLRADFLGVRLGDQEMAAVLVRAARLLNVTAGVLTRPGCLLVTVSDVDERTRVLRTLQTACPAPAANPPRTRTPAPVRVPALV
ncbi:hypothetical protein GCM10022251_44820 [Phytohabitans flavus]|uniref:Uncharacterized protein n=1 Tax=Phytohabitans flavus TaxID=1076124 RepID=A0A6F8XT25_9ACTN|nr:hypothetical protein [Phytohabitans flavus]BCB77002.1 hypothetical protein Pflav_034120 [Phytohabitans flavus]